MTDSATSEPTFPYPPRFRWLKRGAAAGVFLLVSLVVMRLCWGWSSQTRLRETHARIVARGGPVVAEDLNPAQPLPPAENAAAYYSKAIAALKPNVWGPSSSALVYPGFPPYSAQWHNLADAAYAANKPAFALARAARPHAQADWGARYASPRVAWPMPTGLNSARELANQLGDAGLRAHVRGNDATAVEFVRDVRHLAHSVDKQPWLVTHLVALGIEALALNRIMIVAPALEVTDGSDVALGAQPPDGPATRGQVAGMIGELLDDPHPGHATAAVAQGGEFIFARDMNRWFAQRNWVTQPVFDGMETWLADRSAAVGNAATQPSHPAAKDAVAHAHETPRSPSDGWLSSTSEFVKPYSRTITQDMRLLAERRLAAVSLAARLYRLDQGRWPRSHDELVPRYLPAVPRDPFRADGGPLSYLVLKLPAGAVGVDGRDERPIVYHLGDDGRDETTAATALPVVPLYSWHSFGRQPGRNESPDQWRDVSRFSPAPPPPGRLDEDGDGVAESVDANGDGIADPEDEGGEGMIPDAFEEER